MSNPIYKTKEEVLGQATTILHKTLRQVIKNPDLSAIEEKLRDYKTARKGYLGNLVEKYVFGQEPNSRPEPDLMPVGIEVKTTPLKKHAKRQLVAKERLVFSMIDYLKVRDEVWERSSFLKKNQKLLLMFYLYIEEQSILDHEFKFIEYVDLLSKISTQDIEQIRNDWEYIVAKIRRGEAHLLSEGDTFYLGACTKAQNSRVVREQAERKISAKPRAFSFKQSYLNYLVERDLLGKDTEKDSIYRNGDLHKTVEDVIKEKFDKYIGKSDAEIMKMVGWKTKTRSKDFKRLLANRILTGTSSNKVEELEKANITLRVVTLEHTGALRESISFPAFDYKDLANQVWYDEETEVISDLHAALETRKFLFVVFQKTKGADQIVLKKIKFWNFPISDLPEAERVFDLVKTCINEGRYQDLPKMSESKILHVRPHGRTGADTQETPQHTQEVKRCFWLNARYIQGVLTS